MNQVLAVRLNTQRLSRFGSGLESWSREGSVAKNPHLLPSEEPPTPLAAFPRIDHTDLRDGVEWCRSRLESRGMEVLVLDQTRTDIDIPVVRAVVPPLRHFRARFAPGRLYDVPVEMGWLPKACPEAELNPVAFFI